MKQHSKKALAVLLIFSICTGSFTGVRMTNTAESTARAATISEETRWNLRCLNAEKSYEESLHLPKIKVAVLDSGLDFDADIPFVERKDFLEEGGELHSLYQDKTGHGTSVAGLICARKSSDRISGIAANVELYAARILDGKNQAPVERVIEAVKWAMEKQVNILHMSFGTKEYSEELEDIIQQAYRQGILIIAAAGNDGNAGEDESTVEYPAAFEEVVSVGGTDTDNSVMESSSTGEELDVVAPGSQVLSTGAFGGVTAAYGTSISAAHVTGIAAVLWGKHPEKSHEFIRGLLVGSANAEAVSGDCGNGMVDYTQSVENYEAMNTVYEAYKKQGHSEAYAVRQAESRLPANEKTVSSHKREINYVNGSWINHIPFVVDATQGMKEADISLVKAGATLPDLLGQMSHMEPHPCFHGAGNYFANVKYLLEYAQLLMQEDKDELAEFEGYFKDGFAYTDLTRESKYNIKKELSDSVRNTFYTACANQIGSSQPLTNRQKGYAILGLALHTITDTFAHKGYRKDTLYDKVFCEIKHDWREDKSKNTGDWVSILWDELKKSPETTKDEKDYYSYMLDNFCCADTAEQMQVRSVLAQKASTELVASLNGTDDYLERLAKILEGYKSIQTGDTEAIDQPKYYRLANVNQNWDSVKKDGKKFAINIDEEETDLVAPKKKELQVTVGSKNMTITLASMKKNYRYKFYYLDKKGKKVFFKTSGKKHSTSLKGMKKMQGKEIHLISFWKSSRKLSHYTVDYTITYIYKKKRKKRKITFNPKKLSFKLHGNVFRLKKKEFKGWSKKKNAKKAKYKPAGKMKFTGNGNLKLYCVTK